MTEPRDATAPVAIIGMACLFPGAPDLQTFWNNILHGVDAICEPVEAWGAPRYLGSGRIKTHYGGYLRDLYRFDPREFGIMPSSIDGSEPDQFLALRIARDALADAGYHRPDADHTDTGIVLGHSTYLHRGQGTLIQQHIVLDQTIEVLRASLPHLDEAALARVRSLLAKRLPPSKADTVPGLVPNVMTGRIANRLNLRGPNYLLDAACSSSLLAVGAAIDELRAGRSRMMLAGGVNATLPAEVTTIFTQLDALTTRRKVRPFSVGSDGTLLGEGLGIVVLKRLDDALADGDRIYAVVRGVGQSSDGRGAGLLAPSEAGEALAIRRTYETSGVDPASVGLVEAHGTGIPLGDRTEIAALRSVFGPRVTPAGTVAIGSVKSMISHCIPAAGIAGLIKTALAVHHKVLPPTLCDEVNPALGIADTPFYVNTRAEPWIARLEAPRRAGVNAFGFGGTNSHAILEEAPARARVPPKLAAWPAELCVVSAPTVAELTAALERLAAAIAANTAWRLPEVAAALARADQGGQHRIAIVARDLAGLAKEIERSIARLRSDGQRPWPTRGGIAYGARRLEGKLAFLFPGEGSQFQRMLAELALHFDEVREWLDFWHGMHELPRGATRTDIAYPSVEIDAGRRTQLEKELHTMDVGSEAVYVGGLALYSLLRSLGIEPDMMLGHSSGESVALTASGANPATDRRRIADCIARHHAVYRTLLESGRIPAGALLAVGALPAAAVEAGIAGLEGVSMAMDNCSNQMVLYGPKPEIERLQTALAARGGVCLPLPFDRGYHTPAFDAASAAFLEYYEEIGLGAPAIPLYSCCSAGLFPQDAPAARRLAAEQWSRQVRFRETILRMHEDGARLFIEVGPSANLTAFVQDILRGRDFLALPTNVRGRPEVEQVLAVLGQLYVLGRGPALERLFAGRAIAPIDLAAPARPAGGAVIDNTMPVIRLSPEDRESIRAIVAAAAPTAAVEAVEATEAVEAVEPVDVVEAAAPTAEACGELPLLDAVLERQPTRVRARSVISLAEDNFARDHVMTGPVSQTDPRLHGLSCVPLAVSLELMAEACALLAGRTDLRVIESVRPSDWIGLDDDEVTVEVEAQTLDAARGHYRASVSTARGVALSAELRFGEAAPPAQTLPPLLERRESCWNAPHLYTTGMFHGPVFRSLRHIDAWDDTGVDVQLSELSLSGFFADGHTPRLILNPVLLDSLGQVVACWLAQFFGTEFNNFPSSIGRIELCESCPADRPGVLMRARQRPLDGAATDPGAPRAWQFECTDAAGRVLLRADAMTNVFWRLPSPFHAVRWRPLLGCLGRPVAAAGGGLQWEVPLLSVDFLSQSGAICLRTLAHALLNAGERREWRSLQEPIRQRIEWLFARAAVKEAVRYWIHEQTGELLYPTDIVVGADTRGAPVAHGSWHDTLIAAPRISLTFDGTKFRVTLAPPEKADETGVTLGDVEHLPLVAHGSPPELAG